MPIYEYQCDKCGKTTEVFQLRSTDAPPTKCPRCGSKKIHRLVSQTAFQLKGGGWYKDLYSSVKPGTDSSSDGTMVTSESKSGDKKTDTGKKSESKSESKPKEKKESKAKAKTKD